MISNYNGYVSYLYYSRKLAEGEHSIPRSLFRKAPDVSERESVKAHLRYRLGNPPVRVWLEDGTIWLAKR